MIQFNIFQKFPEIVNGITVEPPNLKLFFMKQRHTNLVDFIDSSSNCDIKRDGIITNRSNIILGIKTADCVPVLLFDPKTKMIGAVHAGWKGSLNGIINNGISHFKKRGASPKDMLIGIGPAICGNCYDISCERAEQFADSFPNWQDKIIDEKNRKIYLNIPKLITLQLIKDGVQVKNIEHIDICAFENTDFYSYRRGDRDKRIISFIQII